MKTCLLLAVLFGSRAALAGPSCEDYARNAATYRQKANEEEQKAARVGPTLGTQHRAAANAYRQAAAKADAEAAKCRSQDAGGGGSNATGGGNVPTFGGSRRSTDNDEPIEEPEDDSGTQAKDLLDRWNQTDRARLAEARRISKAAFDEVLQQLCGTSANAQNPSCTTGGRNRDLRQAVTSGTAAKRYSTTMLSKRFGVGLRTGGWNPKKPTFIRDRVIKLCTTSPQCATTTITNVELELKVQKVAKENSLAGSCLPSWPQDHYIFTLVARNMNVEEVGLLVKAGALETTGTPNWHHGREFTPANRIAAGANKEIEMRADCVIGNPIGGMFTVNIQLLDP